MKRYELNKFTEKELRIFGMRLQSGIIVLLGFLVSMFNLIAHFTFLRFLGSLCLIIFLVTCCHFLIERGLLARLFDEKLPDEIHNDFLKDEESVPE